MTDIPTNYKMLGYWNKLAKQRIQAFESRDAKKYYNLCLEMGVSPESGEIFNQGKLEVALENARRNL